MVLVSLLVAIVPGRADAAVAYRAQACGTGPGSTIDVVAPSSARPGDLEVVTVAATGDAGDIIYEPSGSDWQWGGVGSAEGNLLAASFYRRVTASDPATWTFFMLNGSASSMSYGLIAFSGVDQHHAPIVDAQESTSPSAPSHVVPDGSGPFDGMMRYVASSAAGSGSQAFSGAVAAGCDEVAGPALANGYEAAMNGTTPSRSVTHAAPAEAIVHAILLRPACSDGGLGVLAPTAIHFPSRTLTGFDGSTSTTFTVDVDDERASTQGWHLTLDASRFATPGGERLPVDAASIESVTALARPDQCSPPDPSISAPVTLGNGPIVVFNTQAGLAGQGPTALELAAKLSYPGSVRIGTYESTWTVSLESGP